MCSPASVIFESIVTILIEFLFKMASKLTRIATIHVSIALAGEHIFLQVLAQYS